MDPIFILCHYAISSFHTDLKSLFGNLNVNRGVQRGLMVLPRRLSGDTLEWWPSADNRRRVNLWSEQLIKNTSHSEFIEAGAKWPGFNSWGRMILCNKRSPIPGTGSSETKTNQGMLWPRPALRSWTHADMTSQGLSGECRAARWELTTDPNSPLGWEGA